MFERESRLAALADVVSSLSIGEDGGGVEEGGGSDGAADVPGPMDGGPDVVDDIVHTEQAALADGEEGHEPTGDLPAEGQLPDAEAAQGQDALPELDDATFEALAQQRGYGRVAQQQQQASQEPPPWLEPLVAPMRDVSQQLRDMAQYQLQQQQAQQFERQRPQRPPENATAAEQYEYAERLSDWKANQVQRSFGGQLETMKNILRQTTERLEQQTIQTQQRAAFMEARAEQSALIADPQFAWLKGKPGAQASIILAHQTARRAGHDVSLRDVAMEMAREFGTVKTQASANQTRRQASTANLQAARKDARAVAAKRPGPAAASSRGGKPVDAKKQQRILNLAKAGALPAEQAEAYRKQGFRIH